MSNVLVPGLIFIRCAQITLFLEMQSWEQGKKQTVLTVGFSNLCYLLQFLVKMWNGNGWANKGVIDNFEIASQPSFHIVHLGR